MSRAALASATAAALVLALGGCGAPASTLDTSGVTGAAETWLGWFVLALSGAVVLVTWALVLAASLRRRRPPLPAGALVTGEGRGLTWIMVGGIVVPGIALTVLFLWTALTLRAVSAPDRPYGARLEVIGHQWWWEVRYLDGASGQQVTTANEIHVPLGQPVRVELATADVIHSFWVPRLAGKMDLIPGQKNVTWIEARLPGTYLGECGEYCGLQHAHMQLRVVAEAPARFQAWLAAQRLAAPAPATPAQAAGQKVFLGAGCAACHAIRGTPAAGALGPDLTHVMSRGTIAAGSLPNTAGARAGWIADAQGIKPGALMPTMAVPPRQLQALLGYVATLR